MPEPVSLLPHCVAMVSSATSIRVLLAPAYLRLELLDEFYTLLNRLHVAAGVMYPDIAGRLIPCRLGEFFGIYLLAAQPDGEDSTDVGVADHALQYP